MYLIIENETVVSIYWLGVKSGSVCLNAKLIFWQVLRRVTQRSPLAALSLSPLFNLIFWKSPAQIGRLRRKGAELK